MEKIVKPKKNGDKIFLFLKKMPFFSSKKEDQPSVWEACKFFTFSL